MVVELFNTGFYFHSAEETAERTVEGLKGCVRLSGRSCWRCSKRAEEKRILCLPTSVTLADVGPMMLLQLTLLAPLHLLWVAGSEGQPCEWYLEGKRNGTITSPNFPSAHKTPLECIWTIRNPKPGRNYIYVYLLQNYLSCQSSALTYLEYQSVSNLTDSYIYSSNFNSRNDCGGSLHVIRSSKAFLQVKLTSMLTRLSSTSSGLFGFNATYTTMPTDNQPMPICSQSCSEAGFCRSLQDYSGFYCECFEGFSGRHCQYNDICDYRRRLNPCLNNGTCTVVKYGAQTSVVCACQRGYLGERCETIITCPVLQDPPDGKVSPPPCRDSRSRVGDTCYFTCDNTYVQSGPSFKTCLSDGDWTQEKEFTACRDVTPPYFGDTCPGDMNLRNEKCENKVLLNFTVPTAVDNSGYVKVDGPETKPPIYLAGGQYTWIYTASDDAKNEARCQIAIGVQVVKCPTIKVPHNVEVTGKSCGSLYGSEVQFVCKEGFKLMGSGIRTCGPNGEWEGGDVQCIAQLGDGTVRLHKRPGKPRDLHIVEKGPRMVKLSWLPPAASKGARRTKLAYRVQFRSERLRITWTDLFKELLISGTRITLPLSPWVDYTFRVIAADRSGDSEPSEPSELYDTPPAPPGQIPERIKVAGLSATSFRVSWRTLPLVDHNGPDLRYLVSWRLQNETCWKLNLWKTATVGGSMSSYVVRNVTSGLLYEVTVQAANSKGQGPVSAPRHGQSLPALKRAPVLITPKREFNASISSTVELTCDAVGAVRSRRLWFNEARIVPTKLIQGTGSLLLDKVHFKDEGCYKCYAENDRGSTEGCRCLRVYGSRNITTTQTSITQPLRAPYTPFKLELSDKRATSVILSWTPWPSDHRPSEHFIVQYETTFEPSKWREMIGFVPGNATKSLLELSPFVNYRFRVIAVNWVGRSDPSDISESYHTPPSAPEVFPKEIQAQGIYNRDLIVRWEPLGWYERNGPGVQYKIFWRILYCNAELLGDWESSIVQGEEKSSYVILNLIRDLPYQVQLQVLNNQGAGPISYPPVLGHAGDQGHVLLAGRPGTRPPCATFEATLPPRITSDSDGSLTPGENVPWMSSASTFPDLKYAYPTDPSITDVSARGVLDQSNNSVFTPTSLVWVDTVTHGVGFDIVNFFEDYSGIVGTRLLITCIARGPRRMHFKWFKGEYRIMASDWTRISVSPKVIRNDGDLESVLEINPTTPLDRGTYRCAVSDQGVERSCSLNITVLTKPSVQLDPVTATVLVSSPVKLTCTVRSPGGVEPQVKWFIGKDRVTDLRAISNLGNGMYRLTVLGTVEGTKYTCMASNAAGTTIAESIVTVVRKDAHDVCGQETFQNVEWGMTQAGGVYYQLCPGGSTGYATRQCLLNDMDFTPYWLEPNFVQCTTYDFEALLSNTRMLTSGIEVTSVEKIAETLNSITTPNLYGGNLRLASDIIQEMILYKEKTRRKMSKRELEDVLWSASNVLSLYNKEEWMNLQEGSSGSSWILGNLTRYSRLVTFELEEGGKPLSTSTDNLVMEVGKVAVKGLDVIEFPATPKARTWVGTDRIEVPGKALRNSYEESQVVGVSSFLYRTIKDLLPGNDFLLRDSKIINTRVISLSLFPPPPGELDPPVRVELAHENASFVDPECVSWDFGIQLPNRTTKGGWSTEGCAVLLSNDSHTVCQCKHLTDFAVLVTPFVPKMDAPSANEISFIVAIGCGIAMLEIASVILVYILLWRCIRCDRSVIVLNLSLSLLNANGVFLGGIPQKWNKTICTAVAAMLHYFFLAAFCWMLAEGWHMYSSLVRTNGKLSKAKLYIALGWLLPAAVVGVSLGITKTNGYGNDKHCWITLDSQLPLALAAPACAVVAANLVILLLVVKAMLNSMAKKVDKDRTRTALWSSCVILPLLGATVVLAVFAVNRSAVLFQYLFAMCNTLLGLFMLLFYCVGNKQVLDIVKSRMCAAEETDPPSDPDVAISAQNPTAKKVDANGRPITYTAAVHVDGPMTVVEKIDHVTHEEHEMEMIDVVVTSEQERRAQAEALLRRQGHSRTLERDPRYGPCPKPRQAAEQRPVSLEVPIHTMPRNPRHDGSSPRMMTTFKPDDMEQYHTASTLRVQLDPRPTKPQPGAIRVLPGHGPSVAQGKHLDYEPVKHSSCEELDRTDKYKADHVVMNTNASPSPHIVEGQTLSRAAFRSLKRSLSNPKWKQQGPGQPEGPSDREATPSSIEMTEFYKSYSDI
ncbi:uncharacterized protein LOC144917345 isoform X9 [Branchiostoma floridae x Branchiostoma belcheri]